MMSLHQLSWENFLSTVFVPGQQRVHRVTASPLIELFGDGIANRVGLWLGIPSDAGIPPEVERLALITTRTFSRDGGVVLEISTSARSLQRQFYHFAVAVAERVVVERRPALEAVGLELQCFTDLLEAKAVLGIERQIGLLGELLFLERLIENMGESALESWIAPTPEPHDFRVGTREFEVKSTIYSNRIHTINGTEQLIPSLECSLYLVSILLGPAGADGGVSLSDKVTQLVERLSSNSNRLNQFRNALEDSGFREQDRSQYTRRFALRRPFALIEINEAFPAVTRRTLEDGLGLLAARIKSLKYDVNAEGLGYEDGTPEFDSVIPH